MFYKCNSYFELLVIFSFLIVSGCSNIAKDYDIGNNPDIFTGKVIKGKQEARKLGVPTANIEILADKVREGVYCCNVQTKENLYKAICYYSLARPNILEDHIFNYNGNLYNKTISISLKTFIRKPIKNLSLNQLMDIIRQDISLCHDSFKDSK